MKRPSIPLARRAADRLVRTAAPVPRGVRDTVLALVICVVQLGAMVFTGHRQGEGPRALDALGVVLIALGPLALFVRRRYPAAVLVVSVTSALAYVLLDYPRGPIFLAMIVALVGAFAAGLRRQAYVVLALGYVGFVWVAPAVTDAELPAAAVALGIAAWLLVLAGVGEVVRLRRAYRAAERRREHVQSLGLAEAERRRAADERLRIARELHDVLAHHISLMNVQASVGLELMDASPEQAREALTAVKYASREALGELRSVLDILKGDSGDRLGPDGVPRKPTAGLAQLADLVERTSAGGLTVRVEHAGTARALGAAVDLAAFRIVQEALTNTLRHAGAGEAVVRVEYGADGLDVSVRDDGRPAHGDRFRAAHEAPVSGGNGLHGMRQRAAALGGRCEAGPAPGRGFLVRAHLPYGEPPSGHDGAGSSAAEVAGADDGSTTVLKGDA